MIAFITGPLLWFSCVFFIAGSLVRLLLPDFRIPAERLVRKPGPKPAADMWQAPLAKKGGERSCDPVPLPLPAWGLVLLVVGLPLFYQGHGELVSFYWDINWPAFSQFYSDILGTVALAAAVLAALGLVALPGNSGTGRPVVFVLMLLCALPFFTGLMARYRMPGYTYWMLAHVLVGELLLIAIPCTGLFRILFFFLPFKGRARSAESA